MVKDEKILNKIAKEWASGILYWGTKDNAFNKNSSLSVEEQHYIVDKIRELALNINNKKEPLMELENIVERYFE